jgi:hypothetical protein
MNKENVIHTHNEVFFSHFKKSEFMLFAGKMDRTGNNHIKQDKPSSDK